MDADMFWRHGSEGLHLSRYVNFGRIDAQDTACSQNTVNNITGRREQGKCVFATFGP